MHFVRTGALTRDYLLSELKQSHFALLFAPVTLYVFCRRDAWSIAAAIMDGCMSEYSLLLSTICGWLMPGIICSGGIKRNPNHQNKPYDRKNAALKSSEVKLTSTCKHDTTISFIEMRGIDAKKSYLVQVLMKLYIHTWTNGT